MQSKRGIDRPSLAFLHKSGHLFKIALMPNIGFDILKNMEE